MNGRSGGSSNSGFRDNNIQRESEEVKIQHGGSRGESVIRSTQSKSPQMKREKKRIKKKI